jgi:DHA3 family macrolide efflux protein-like MFS transporter
MDVATMLLAVIPLCFIPIPQPQIERGLEGPRHKTPFFKDLTQGFKYVISWKGLFLLILLAMLINFMMTPAFSLLPLLVSDHFGGDEVQLALLNSAMGVGMLVGGLALSVWGGFKRRILTSFMGLIASGVAILLVGLTPSNLFWLAAVGLFFSMVTLPMINGPVRAVMQAHVAPEFQGRVFSLVSTGTGLAMPIGLLIAGPVADWIGIPAWFIFGGIVMALSGAAGFISPAMRDIEEQRQEMDQI